MHLLINYYTVAMKKNQEKGRNKIKVYLIVASIIFGVLILPSLPLILMSPMMFDSPGSEDSITTITLVLSIVTYPIVSFIGIAMSWVLYIKHKNVIALICVNLPILNIIIGIGAIIYLSIFCDGNFNC